MIFICVVDRAVVGSLHYYQLVSQSAVSWLWSAVNKKANLADLDKSWYPRIHDNGIITEPKFNPLEIGRYTGC